MVDTIKVRITGIHPSSSWSKSRKANFVGRHAYVKVAYHMDANCHNVRHHRTTTSPFASGEVVFCKRGVIDNPAVCIHGFTYEIVKKGRSSSCSIARKQMPLL